MRIACVATKMYEDSELDEPVKALRAAGHEVVVISPKRDEIEGKNHKSKVKPDLTIDEARADQFDALFVPGGFSPDQLRADPRFVAFTKAFKYKPIMAICHGPQLLFTAGVLDGHCVTAWRTVQFDLEKAGLEVCDDEVCIDGNLVTSRMPADIPAFNKAIVELLAKGPQAPRAKKGAGAGQAAH